MYLDGINWTAHGYAALERRRAEAAGKLAGKDQRIRFAAEAFDEKLRSCESDIARLNRRMGDARYEISFKSFPNPDYFELLTEIPKKIAKLEFEFQDLTSKKFEAMAAADKLNPGERLVSDLHGDDLDYWVVKLAEWLFALRFDMPSRDFSEGGQIIEHAQIAISPLTKGRWKSTIRRGSVAVTHTGATALVTAMQGFVIFWLGDIVYPFETPEVM